MHTLRTFLVFLQKTGRVKDGQMATKAISSFAKSLDGDEPRLDQLTEAMLRQWIDGIMHRLSIATITRYVESLSRIFDYAVRLNAVGRSDIFDNVKEYVAGMCDEGFDKISQRRIDAIRRLASVKTTALSTMGHAVDVYLYSFYHAGLDVETIIDLHIDDDSLCSLPHTDAIKEKYSAPIRKYVFPLRQWQRTPNQIRLSLDSAFRNYLQMNDIKLGGKSIPEFIATAWVAAAKACGVSNADICACCTGVTDNPKLKDIVPSRLTDRQKEAIKLKVANSIIDLTRHWYAIRFVGKETLVSKELEEICAGNYLKTYYPIEEICKRVGRRRVVENRPTICNIIFIQTMPKTLLTILRKKDPDSRYYVIRNKTTEDNDFAIIPDAEMRKFSILVSNGLDILGAEEMEHVEVLAGSYVQITEGLYKGFSGKVLKVRNKDNSQSTMLEIEADKFGPEMEEILGKRLYITIPQELVETLPLN